MGASFENPHVCVDEISSMLSCFEDHDGDTEPCHREIELMYKCGEERSGDPDPKMLARRWQINLRSQVLQHFARKRLR